MGNIKLSDLTIKTLAGGKLAAYVRRIIQNVAIAYRFSVVPVAFILVVRYPKLHNYK